MLESYVVILRRNAVWILVLSLLLAPLMFYGVTARANQYRSQAVIEVTFSTSAEQLLGQQRGYEEPQRRVTTEAELVTSLPVADRAAARLRAEGRREDVGQLLAKVQATPRRSSNYVEISGTDSTPVRAQGVAEAFAKEYLDYRRDLQKVELERLQADLNTARTSARQDLAAASEADSGAVRARLRNIDALLDSVRLRLSVDTTGITLLSDASLPQEPTNAVSTRTAALVAVMGGVLAAMALVLLLELLRNEVRTRKEAERLTDLPVLGVIDRPVRARWGQAAAAGELLPGHGERGLRLALAAHSGGRLPSTLMLASLPADAEDCVLISRSLAASCLASGLTVLLIANEAQDNGRPAPEGGDERSPAVSHRVSLSKVLPGLHEAAATSVHGSSGVFDLPEPAAALREFATAFDVVIVAVSGLHGLNPVDVGALVQTSVPVCALTRTRAQAFRRLVTALVSVGTDLPGVALTEGRRQRRGRPDGVKPARTVVSPGTRMHPRPQADRPTVPIRTAP